jgi:hypothetical protein
MILARLLATSETSGAQLHEAIPARMRKQMHVLKRRAIDDLLGGPT